MLVVDVFGALREFITHLTKRSARERRFLVRVLAYKLDEDLYGYILYVTFLKQM